MKETLLQVLMGTIGTMGFAILFNIRGKKFWLAGLGGCLSWGLFLLLFPIMESEVTRYYVCAVFAAAYSEILARLLKTPATTFMMISLLPHIPGGALYRTMRYALNRSWRLSWESALHTLKLALALALGIVTVLTVLSVLSRVMLPKKKEQVH